MLQKIAPEQVTLGMYVHSLEGAWLNHPFWRSQFLVEDATDLDALRSAGLKAVVIDTVKGHALSGDRSAEPLPGPELPAAIDTAPPRPSRTKQKPVNLDLRPCSVAEELDRAGLILEQSKAAMRQLFADVRLGKAVDDAAAATVVHSVTQSVTRNASALTSIARLKHKDEYTYMHSVAVCALMVSLARQLGLDDETVRQAGMAGLLHDLGKIAVPLDVLNKPGSLTDDEFAVIRLHPERGHQALLQVDGMPDGALDVCLHHHERFDGSGYPHGLRGEEISLLSRMASICDVYDAISSNRPYKSAWSASDSLARMYKWDGHFDRDLLAAFIRTVGIYPVGTLVRLRSGRTALVVEQHAEDLTRPLVRLFTVAGGIAVAREDVDLRFTPGEQIVGRAAADDPNVCGWDGEWLPLLRRSEGSAATQ